MNANEYQSRKKSRVGSLVCLRGGTTATSVGRVAGSILMGLTASALLALWTACASASDLRIAQGESALRATLANGLRVVIVPNRLAPVATVVVNYQVGSNQAPEKFPGTAHALEHMMFRGSPGLSGQQLANVAASIGGRFNADTQQTLTQYFFTVPVQDLDVVLHIESLRMRGILADEKSWRQERGAIEQEVAQDLSNPQYQAYTQLQAALFKGTPYAQTPLGTRLSFEQTSAAMLKKFHDMWYAPNNAVLVVVGDVQPHDTLGRIKALFGNIPAGRLPNKTEVHLNPVIPETFDLKTDLPYGLVLMGFRLPGSDSPEAAAVQVLADVLDSERGDIHGLVTEGMALFTGFSTRIFSQTAGGFAMAAFPKGADAATLIEALRNRLIVAAQRGISPELVAAAKRREITAAELKKNSMLGLALAWSQAVASEGRRSPQEALEAIRQVSADDVRAVAQKYLNPRQAVVAVLTPQASGEPISTGVFGKGESFGLKEATAAEIPQWARNSWQRLGIPASNVHPTETTLPNGLKLIVQSENAGTTVNVYGHIQCSPDLTEPTGKEGVNQVLEALFPYGTTSLDRLAFQKALDDIGAVESAGADFSLQVLSDQFEPGIRLLADNLLHPALPEKAFRIVRQQMAATTAGQLQSPDYLAGQALRQALFPKNDPTLRHATRESVMALSLPDIIAYHRKMYRPDLTTLVVIGNVSVDTARGVALKYFGTWEARGPKPDVTLPAVPDNKPSVVVVPNDTRVQDRVVLAETLKLSRSDPDYYALELGNHVLGGGFYATRLYRELREKLGLVYHIDTSFFVDKTRARYVAHYACDPADVSVAHDVVERNLQRMQTDPVSPRELNMAKAMVLRRIPLSESSLESIALGLISRTELGLPLNEPFLAAEHYLELTADMVRSAFARRLRPHGLVRIVEGPTPG